MATAYTALAQSIAVKILKIFSDRREWQIQNCLCMGVGINVGINSSGCQWKVERTKAFKPNEDKLFMIGSTSAGDLGLQRLNSMICNKLTTSSPRPPHGATSVAIHVQRSSCRIKFTENQWVYLRPRDTPLERISIIVYVLPSAVVVWWLTRRWQPTARRVSGTSFDVCRSSSTAVAARLSAGR